MMKPALAALVLILSAAAPALAQDGTTETAVTAEVTETPAPAPPATLRAGDIAPDGTKIKCRKIEVIGTRFGKRECKSEAAWKQFDTATAANAKESTDRIQRTLSSGATN